MDGDGRAALACFPVDVMLAGQSFRIGARPARAWLLLIAEENWLAIVPAMIDGDEILDLIDVGRLDRAELVAAARDAVEAVSGMRWWSACRLAKALVGGIELVGAMVLAGVDPDRISIGGYLAAAYRILIEHRDDKQRSALDAELMAAPQLPPDEDSDQYDPETAGEQFERFFHRFGGKS